MVGEGKIDDTRVSGKIESWLNLLICLYKQLRILRVGVYREISVAVINRSYRSIFC